MALPLSLSSAFRARSATPRAELAQGRVSQPPFRAPLPSRPPAPSGLPSPARARGQRPSDGRPAATCAPPPPLGPGGGRGTRGPPRAEGRGPGRRTWRPGGLRCPRARVCSGPDAAGGPTGPAAHRKPAPANVRPFYNPLVTHNRPAACAAKPPASAPSCLFLEPTARKTFFFFFFFLKEKSKKPSAPRIGVFPFPFLAGPSLCVFSLDTRRVLSCPRAARLGLQPLFGMKRKRIQMSARSPEGKLLLFATGWQGCLDKTLPQEKEGAAAAQK